MGKDGATGAKGDVGKEGAAGAGCSVTSKTDSSATVKCGDDSFVVKLNGGGIIETTEENEIEDVAITGASQKGPFVNGAKVTLYELDGSRSLSQTGRTFSGNITSNDGKFAVNNISLKSRYAKLEANGFYRNEVTGENSKTAIILNAYTDLAVRSKVNVNLLTHLEYYRVNYLMSLGNMKLSAAKKQAQREIFRTVFGVDATNYGYSEDLDIFGSGEGDAALLALSIMLQGDRSEADLTTLLTSFGQDIEKDSTWDDPKARAEIATWIEKIDGGYCRLVGTDRVCDSLESIRSKMEKWNLDGSIPNFEKFARKFWRKEYKLGACGDSVKVGTLDYAKNPNVADYAVDYGDTTKSKRRFICSDKNLGGVEYTRGPRWRLASRIESDSAGLEPCTPETDGMVLHGTVYKDSAYTCNYKPSNLEQDSGWAYATVEEREIGSCRRNKVAVKLCHGCRHYESGGCTSIGYWVNNTYMYCDGEKWSEASSLQKNTYGLECYEDGRLVKGLVDSKPIFTCDNGVYREASDSLTTFIDTACVSYLNGETRTMQKNGTKWKCTDGVWKWNGNAVSGTVVDDRDGQTYKTVAIGAQTWMAEDLRYAENGSCNGGEESCAQKGLLYDEVSFAEQNFDRCEANPCFSSCIPGEKIQDKCPVGWRLPNVWDWRELIENVGGKVSESSSGESVEYSGANLMSGDSYGFSIRCLQDDDSSPENGSTCSSSVDDRSEYDATAKTLTDYRDGQIYKTVTIGNQDWMAENLNYAYKKGSAWSYCNDCDKYGRYYSWSAAMDSAAVFGTAGKDCGYGGSCVLDASASQVRGVCPKGWHLPSDDEWNALYTAMDNSASAMRATTWSEGTDTYGFTSLPAGYYCGGAEYNVDENAFFWSTVGDASGSSAYFWVVGSGSASISNISRMCGLSVRCLKD